MKLQSLFVIACVLLVGCTGAPTPKRRVRCYADIAMTIPYRILVVDGDSRCKEIIDSTFSEVDAIYNNWNPGSEISRLNQLAADSPLPLSPQLHDFLLSVGELVAMTDGLFDPTVGPLKSLWKSSLEAGLCPSASELEALRDAIGWDKISIFDNTFSKKHPMTALDFGGVAKGYCVDILQERLLAAGYKDLYVSWGGEICTAGQHPDGRPWTVAIRDPRGLEFPPLHTYSLNDQSIATSGDYEQYWIAENESAYSHICNPLTLSAQQLKENSITSVTVLADSCMMADALATAVMLQESLEEAQALAARIEGEIPGVSFFIASRARQEGCP